MKINIELIGCDDTTYLNELEVTEEEYNFVKRLEKLSKAESSYCCMPTLEVTEMTH